ncbi:phospholipid/cholesterol/gamma-HCH transport system substrate-binding protein [Nocardioides sp. J9]|uniref:MlaD family protein n=1 Tax=unclassified Nocardioides TaxID=2615069 RepID=UPI00048E4DE8|nr:MULTISPECIES: MlaD family protein [unclassified Nocardioides]TWH00872.1 phospholipid/cholesterol/gamma-HCH transport system substrate-binding protein [Nocardioides sp. J9]
MSATQVRMVAVAVATALGLSITIGTTASMMSDEDPDVYVYFSDASPLIKGNDVKSAGVKVGTIGSIEVEDGIAKVGLVLDDEVLPIHSDATARVRPVGLLGERFVELDRGSPEAEVLAEGASLPVEQSSRATDLDEVLDMVDAPTGTALSMLVTTLGQGILGKGEKADRAIKALAPALQDTDRLARILNDQNGVLKQLVDEVTPVAEQLATDKGVALDRLVGAADKTLTATARSDRALSATLERLPAALREARTTLAALAGAAGSTAPVLAALRPVTQDLVRISKELESFSKSAEPALNGLDPVLDKAEVLLERARPVARSLQDLSPDLRTTAHHGREIATQALDNLTTVMDFIRSWALTTNGQDGLAHYFRAHVVVTTEVLTGLLPGGEDALKPAPSGSAGKPGTKGSGGDGGQSGAKPPLGGLLDGLEDLVGPLGGLLGGGKTSTRAADGGSATGLSTSQEKNLLSYLIGGR